MAAPTNQGLITEAGLFIVTESGDYIVSSSAVHVPQGSGEILCTEGGVACTRKVMKYSVLNVIGGKVLQEAVNRIESLEACVIELSG